VAGGLAGRDTGGMGLGMADEATRQNLAASTLTGRQEKAARLVAEDDLTNEQIATECGVKRQTLDLWKKRPDFISRVFDHTESFKEAALTAGFADKRARLMLLNAMASDIAAMLQAHGYVREEVKMAANGEHISYTVFDQPAVAQLRGMLDDIAKELGERKTIIDATIKDREIEEAAERLAQRTGQPREVMLAELRARTKGIERKAS